MAETAHETAPIDRLMALDPTKRRAFLGLFAGARLDLKAFRHGQTGEVQTPNFGKAECEWVDDWRDFYARELPELGFTTFEEGETRPALGMVAGSTCWDIAIGITDDGHAAREAFWGRLRSTADE